MHSAKRSLLQLGEVDMEQIERAERKIDAAHKAVNTHKAYHFCWNAFVAWCKAAGCDSLPADPRTAQKFVTWSLDHGYRVCTVSLRMSAIRHYHREAGYESPIDEKLRCHLANARRMLKEKPGGKAAITYDILQSISRGLPDTVSGIRNRAMILLAFASGWRRTEVLSLELADVRFVPRGLEMWLSSSKTDQKGDGRLVGIEPGQRALTCPVAALRAWIALRGDWQGPLFPRILPGGMISREALGARGVALHRVLREILEVIGEDEKRFGAHSLRAGMITEAAKHGASEAAIMQRTGHRSSATLRRYIRPATAFDFNPLKGVL